MLLAAGMIGRLTRRVTVVAAAVAVFAPAANAAVTFAPKQDFGATDAFALVSGDFNGDGRPDVAVASFAGTTISVLLGNGDGTLQAPLNTTGPSQQTAIAAGDFNGDGRDDVVVTDLSAAASVFLSNADGTLSAAGSDPVGASPQDVTVARLNGDTSLDLAIAAQTGEEVTILLNDGSGGFTAAPAVPHALPGSPDGVVAADFDGDGHNDLAIGTTGGGEVAFARNTGTGAGAFDAPVGLGTDGQKVAAGDLNGDGRLDIAASRTLVGSVAIILREASGFAAATTFDPLPMVSNNISQLAVADLDGDGALDLAVPQLNGPEAAKVTVAIGRNNGQFDLGSHEPVDADPRKVVVADFDGDGNPDLATANDGTNDVSVLKAVPPTVVVTPALDFTDQIAGVTSDPLPATVTNNGQPHLRPGAATLGGPDAAEFALASNTCTGARVAPGGSCAIGVTYTPSAPGEDSATLTVASNGGGTPHVVQLTGSGRSAVTCLGAPANLISGTTGRDTLRGTAGVDSIIGLGRSDNLNGLGGDDCIFGGGGRDTLRGSGGADRLVGGAAGDRLIGGPTGDQLVGGRGGDRLNGGRGGNAYNGGRGNDRIAARNGKNELVFCGPGRDRAVVDRRDRVRDCERVRRR
jgi:hypothetical protein